MKRSLLFTLIPQWKRSYTLFCFLACLAGFMAFYWDMTSPSHSASDSLKAEDPETAATFIPAGFVLVPIEVANYESLDSILGKHGVVDLYVAAEDSRQRPRKIAERVKILRAPLNPSHFAVLAPESDSPALVSHSGPFLVVVQNPKQVGTGFVKQPDRTGSDLSRTQERVPLRKRNRITVEVSSVETEP